MLSTHTLTYRQAGLLLMVGACLGCAEGVPILEGTDVVILPQLPDLPDASVRDAGSPVAALPSGTGNPPGVSAPAPSPAPIAPSPTPVVTDAGIADAGSAADAGG